MALYSTLVNPGMHIPSSATAVNHITDDMVEDQPKIEEVLDGFLEFVGNDVLVGHNIHSFDYLLDLDSEKIAALFQKFKLKQ